MKVVEVVQLYRNICNNVIKTSFAEIEVRIIQKYDNITEEFMEIGQIAVPEIL